MPTAVKTVQGVELEKTIKDIIETIDREREREIISRRFGLYDRKETLEQIGELLGITRERVRQLEKVVLNKLKLAGKNNQLPGLEQSEQAIVDLLNTNGNAMRVLQLAELLYNTNDKITQSRIAFLATLAPALDTIDENDHYYSSVTQNAILTEKDAKEQTIKIVANIKNNGAPQTAKEIAKDLNTDNYHRMQALASTSKALATLNGYWGLIKWPTVNPKNIRDKIYVILSEHGSHMHFNEISEAIKASDFKRKNVTTQAIHNELIKDKRFVLIGRGIYALQEWGFQKGNGCRHYYRSYARSRRAFTQR